MKKVIFTVSAVVCLAISAMFVSCESAAENGCACAFTVLGEGSGSLKVDIADMKYYYAVSTCSDLASALTKEYELEYGQGSIAKINCSGY